MMKQWITITTAVAAGILLGALLIVALGWLGIAVMHNMNPMLGNAQGMMNGMSDMSNMGQMMHPMMHNMGH